MKYSELREKYDELVEQSKEKYMDLNMYGNIQRALRIGSYYCDEEIAENVYCLQRELKNET